MWPQAFKIPMQSYMSPPFSLPLLPAHHPCASSPYSLSSSSSSYPSSCDRFLHFPFLVHHSRGFPRSHRGGCYLAAALGSGLEGARIAPRALAGSPAAGAPMALGAARGAALLSDVTEEFATDFRAPAAMGQEQPQERSPGPNCHPWKRAPPSRPRRNNIMRRLQAPPV